MPYIGAKELKASDIRRFDVTGSTSATHTLTWTAPNEQSLIVTINGVKQHEDAYSVSGTTLTLTSALVSTDKLEVIGINDIGTTITPAQNSVDADKIANDAVTAAKLNTTGTASASTFLRGDMAWATPTDQGKVLQVVQTTKIDTFSGTANGTEISITGMSATITPTSSSSKIMVSAVLNYCAVGTTYGAYFKRGTTIIGVPATAGSRQSIASGLGFTGDGNQIEQGVIEYLDSPATTSGTTYQLFVNNDNSIAIYINRSQFDYNDNRGKRSISTVTLMEIEG